MLRLSTASPDFEAKFARVVAERRESAGDVSKTVSGILHEVRARGDEALAEYTHRFDRYSLANDADWRIAPETCRAAFEALAETSAGAGGGVSPVGAAVSCAHAGVENAAAMATRLVHRITCPSPWRRGSSPAHNRR